ncbi:MAG: carbon starvation protein A [Planctomycetaceae bacterium]|nr:carbon starvation protein A [Planctomycetaceae bacterium]
MNSLWLVVTALAAFLVAYRFYGAFLAAKVAVLNDARVTPAHRLCDNVDYSPTRRLVLFGVHFAAIAGPGPLIGPVLAAQWGYFPGFCWIVIGACVAGGVHDFVILLASVRQDGLSLPKIARNLLGPLSGITTTLATLFIIIATLAGVGMVVVKALGESPWGLFTIIVTIPAALITGFWMNAIRPGRIAEASLIGVTLVLVGVVMGKPFAESAFGPYLKLSESTLSIVLPTYAAIASILPVWVLLCPRDYLSSYMKIGVIALIGVGLFAAQPALNMPATTPFIHGGGPVVGGTVWPFVCIVIMCGALSGFHALIASGTTPKMIDRESDIRPIGYGGMLLEGFVSVTALVAACALEPGDYFKINTDQARYPQMTRMMREKLPLERYEKMFVPKQFNEFEREICTEGEQLGGRTAGAVTLAVGMAKIFSSLPGMKHLIAYWYRFVVMFEALFILTLLETGTRVARFVFQDTVTQLMPQRLAERQPGWLKWLLNVSMSVLVCFLWGYLLYTGNIDRLWRMMGIANQLLAVIALAIGTTYLLQNAPKRVYALCTAIPLVFVVATVFTAGIESIQTWRHEASLLVEQLAHPGAAAAQLSDLGAKLFSVRLTYGIAIMMLALSGLIVVDALRRWGMMLWGPTARKAE